MEVDSFLSSPRWELLEIISKSENGASPIELAENLGTTVSYISQQLKLLEAAGYVKKKRTRAVERGKPRTLFTINKEIFHFLFLTKNLAKKKTLRLNEHKKALINIWLYENESLHEKLEEFYIGTKKYLEEIEGIFITEKKIFIVSKSKKPQLVLEGLHKKIDFLGKLGFSFVLVENLTSFNLKKVYMIYGSSLLLTKEMKGGKEEKEK